MRINELLVESQQLDEGPFGQAVGKAVGGVAKGIGAVAGGIAGIPGAVKKGFKAGKAAVQGEPDAAATQPAPAAATDNKATAPAAASAAKPGGLKGVVDQFKKGFAQGREEPAAAASKTTSAAAAPSTSAAAPAAAPAADPAAEKQSKIGVGQINKIIPTLRTRDLMSLQANLEKTIASKKKAAPAAAAPTATSGPNWDEETGAPLSAKAKAEYATFSPEQKAEIEKNKAEKQARTSKAAPSQAEIDADRDRLLPQNSSIIRTDAALTETLARKVQEQKQHMFETALANGQHSIFKK